MSTANNDLNARSFQPEFKQILQAVFKVESYFADFFAGGIEALDGVTHNENAFYVKTSDIPVVVGNYSRDANTAFLAGTSNSNRFGDRTEVIYVDTPVPYTWDWSFHEGLDRFTVNNSLASAVADRLELQAQEKTEIFNFNHSNFIAASAGEVKPLPAMDADGVLALFNDMAAYLTNQKARGVRKAKVNTELFNLLVDHPKATTAKHSGANIDENTIIKFKGFLIQEVPDEVFVDGAVAYAYVENVAKAFTGINTARTIESHDFDGQALQGAGKAGEFILEDNKKAVIRVDFGGAAPAL